LNDEVFRKLLRIKNKIFIKKCFSFKLKDLRTVSLKALKKIEEKDVADCLQGKLNEEKNFD